MTDEKSDKPEGSRLLTLMRYAVWLLFAMFTSNLAFVLAIFYWIHVAAGN